MSALGSLVVSLALEYAQYNSALDKSEKSALEHAKRVQDTFDGIKGSLMGTATAIAGGIAAAFTIGAFKSLISDAVASGAALKDMELQTGASAGALSALAEVGKYSDTTLEKIGASMNVLTRNMAGATEESKGAGAALAAVGLSLEDFRQMKPEDQMMAVAKALDGFQDGAGKSAVMMALFGKEGAKMLPFMHDLADVGELQARVTDKQKEAADQLDDNWKKLTTTGGETAKEVAMGMVPALDQAVRAAMDMMGGTSGIREALRGLVADGSIERWTRDGVKYLSYVADTVEFIWREFLVLGQAAGGVFMAIVKAVQGDFKGAMQELSSTGQDMVDTFTAPTLGQKFRESLVKVGTTAEETSTKLQKPDLDFRNLANSGKKAADEMDKAAQRGKELAAGLTAQASGLSGDFGKKWNDLASAYVSGAISLEQLVAAQAKLLEQQPFMVDMAKEAAAAHAEFKKLGEEEAKRADSLLNEVQQQRDYVAELGMSKEAVEFLRAAKMELRAETLDSMAAEIEATGVCTQQSMAYRDQANALRELAGLKREGALKELGIESAKATQDAWSKASDKINDQLTDALMRGFESGKGFAENLRDTVVNMFKTMVLRPVVQAIVQPIGQSLAGGFGGGGNAVGQAANAYSQYNTASSVWGLGSQVYAGTMSFSNAAGTFAANATGTGLDGLLATNGAYGTAPSALGGYGAYAPYLGAAAGGLSAYQYGKQYGAVGGMVGGAGTVAAGGAIYGAATGAGAMAGGASALAAIPGWGWAAMAVLALAGSMDKSGTQHQGAASTFSVADGLQNGASQLDYTKVGWGRPNEYNAGMQGFTDNVAQNMARTLDGVAAAFGKQVGYQVTSVFMDDSSSDGAFANLIVKRLDKTLVAWATPENLAGRKELGDGAAGQQQYLDLVAQETLGVLKTMDLPGWAQEMVDAVSGTITVDNMGVLLANINGVQTALMSLGQYMPQLADMTGEVATGLLKAFGGVQNMQAAMGSYYQNFYSESERQAVGLQQVSDAMADLGLGMPATREGFRALVEAQDLNTEAGRGTYAALLGLSGAFASVVTLATDLGAAWKTAGDAMESEIARIRGLVMESTAGGGYAALQSQFGIATAQARAGDQSAASSLPELASALLDAAVGQSGSLVDLQRARAYTANSLQETLAYLPSFDVGTNYVPRDMIAQIHEGEAIVPRAYNPAAGGGGRMGNTARLERLVEVLTAEVASLRAEAQATALNTSKTARALDDLKVDGLTVKTDVAEPLATTVV